MGIKQARINEIKKITDSLFLHEKNEREKNLKKLSAYFSEQDVDVVYQELYPGESTQKIFMLVRYIVNIENPHGFKKIIELTLSPKEATRDIACAGIKDINNEYKIDILIMMLSSKFSDVVLFAVRQLGRVKQSRVVIPVAELLEKWVSDEDIKLSVVYALGKLKDKRALPFLSKLVAKEKGELKEKVLDVMSTFTYGLSHSNIKSILNTANPEIRQMLYHTLIKSKKRGWQKYINKMLRSKELDSIKGSILSFLDNIDNKELFYAVMQLALQDKSEWIKIVAQSSVKRNRSAKSMAWLIDYEKNCDNTKRVLIIKILVGYKKNEKIMNLLIKRFNDSDDPKMKLTAIEGLGRYSQTRSIDLLKKVIRGGEIYCLAAAISLTHLIKADNISELYDILMLEPSEQSIPMQVMLNFLMNVPYGYEIPESIKDRVFELAGSSDDHVRYMAVRCLARVDLIERIIKLIDTSKRDENAHIRGAAIKSLIQILQKNPDEQIAVLESSIGGTFLYHTVHKVLKYMVAKPEYFKSTIDKILDYICENKFNVYEMLSISKLRFFVLLRHQAEGNKFLYMNFLRNEQDRDMRVWVLLRVLNSSSMVSMSGLDIDFLADIYPDCSKAAKIEILKFIEKTFSVSEKANKMIFQQYAKENDKELKEIVKNIIKSKLQKAVLM
ncbi:MAG: HEAT repeat domain-containing protein [Candidatus Omnitrophica bacterium]|nr:HEAT repeat domain-containing protein [Candidatus Omnitrophota bacterium]